MWRVKARYDSLAKSAGFQVGDQVWLNLSTRTKEKSLKLRSSWEGPYISDQQRSLQDPVTSQVEVMVT